MSLALLIFAGVDLFKMERTFFFLGFCLPSIQAVWRGFNADSVLPKLFFWGKGFGKTETESSRPQKEIRYEECGRAGCGNFWRRANPGQK